MTRSLKKNPFVGERRELNPRMVDSQSTALIHLATSAPLLYFSIFFIFFYIRTFSLLFFKF